MKIDFPELQKNAGTSKINYRIIRVTFNIFFLFIYRIIEVLSYEFYIYYRAHIHFQFNEWVLFWYDPEKPQQLVQYILFSIILFLVFLVIQCIRNSQKITFFSIKNKNRKIGLFEFFIVGVFSFTVNLVFVKHFYEFPIGISTSWIVTNLLISYYILFKLNSLKKIYPLLVLFITCSIFILFIRIFYPFMSGEYYLFNEYIDISEKTILKEKVVDNRKFYQENLYYPKFKNVQEFLNSDYEEICLDPDMQAWIGSRIAIPQIKDFSEKNEFSFKWQVYNRSFDLHQHQVLNPVNAWMAGQPLKNNQILYGIANSWLVKQLFELQGGLSYNHWFQFAYSFYIIYAIITFFVFYYLFKDYIWANIGAALFMISAVFRIYQGYFYLVIGQIPINPIRHIFDIFTSAVIFYFFSNYKNFSAKKDTVIICFLIILTIIAQLNGDHYGIALSLAASATFLYFFVITRENKFFIISLLFPIFIVTIMYFSPLTNHIGMKYFIDGFFSFNNPKLQNMFYVFLFFYSLAAWSSYKNPTNPYLLTAIFLCIYVNIVAIHFVWHYNIIYLQFIVVPIFLAFVLLIYSFVNTQENVRCFYKLKILLAFIMAFYFVNSYSHFEKSKHEYLNIFQEHVVYNWNFKRANFYTTMPPQVFEETEKLLDEYSLGKPSVYYLSRYDFMLPVLFGKYSALKYPNIPWFIITDTERKLIIDEIKRDKPQYLFVDTNIDIESQLWTVNNYYVLKDKSLFKENQRRIEMLQQLELIFNEVSPYYRLIEGNQLITVYKRI